VKKIQVLGILPCRGKKDQTIDVVKRLLHTAPMGRQPWKLVTVAGLEDAEVVVATEAHGAVGLVDRNRKRLSYWEGLQYATDAFPDIPVIVNLANDVLPGIDWLLRGYKSYLHTFKGKPALVGFNGDSHGQEHSCHFMIHRELLKKFGGWPVWYRHNFGDTELVSKAMRDSVYAKATFAILFHDHGTCRSMDEHKKDAVYAEGHRHFKEDEKLFKERVSKGFPDIKKEDSNLTFASNVASFSLEKA